MALGSTINPDPLHQEAMFSPLGGGLSSGTPVDLHPAIDSVRKLPEFQPPQPDWMDPLLRNPLVRQLNEKLGGLLDQFVNAINRFLSHLHPPGLNNMPDSVKDLFSGFIGFILVIFALYAFYILLGWLLRLTTRHTPTLASEAPIVDRARLISSGYHAQHAQALAQEGQYENAVRQLYFALLCLLDEKALVPFELARSNREYAETLRRQTPADLESGFAQLARQFEVTRYGRQAVNAEQFASCQSTYQHLQELTTRHE